MLNDPTGHKSCDEELGCAGELPKPMTPTKAPPHYPGEGKDNDATHKHDPKEDLLKSVVDLIFGNRGSGNNTIGYDDDQASFGMGYIVDPRTVRTAQHVYTYRSATQNTVWVQLNGQWFSYDLSNVQVSPLNGKHDTDITLTFLSDLPGGAPAEEAGNYHSATGQPIIVTYHEPIYVEGKFVGYTHHAATATMVNTDLDGYHYVVSNPSRVLRGGASGAPAFFNGQVIAVNGGANDAQADLLAICFRWIFPC